MQTAFQNSHPAVNMLFFVSVLLYGMLFLHPVLLAAAFLASLCTSLQLNGRSTAKQFLRFLLPTLLFVTAVNTIFAHYGVTTLFRVAGTRITLEALTYGFVTGLMVVTVFLWFTCYNAVMTTEKFLYLFGRRFPTAALLISMTLRFIPMFVRRMQEVQKAQKGIGNEGESKLRNALRTVSVVASWSFENAIEVADSMKSRGYGNRKKTTYALFRWTKRDTALTSYMALCNVGMIWGIAKGLTQFSYNPIISVPAVSMPAIFLYIFYVTLVFMPFVLNLSEAIRWNKSR